MTNILIRRRNKIKDGKFEVGDEVECIDNTGCPRLHFGKIYTFIRYTSLLHIEVKNKDGILLTGYLANRFKLAEPSAFQPEYFSALNEKDAEVYIGRTMEFADGSQVRNSDWLKGTLSEIKTVGSCPFHVIGASNYIFMRTCPETFQKKKVKKTVERWINIYPGGSEYSFTTESLANISAGPTRIVCVHLSKEYEVEG